MSSLAIRVQCCSKGLYVNIVEAPVDPVTKKRTSRTVKRYGYLRPGSGQENATEDELPAPVRKDLERLKQSPDEIDELRMQVDRKIYPSIETAKNAIARHCAPSLIYGDAALRRIREEPDLPQWFHKVKYNAKLTCDLDPAVFYMTMSRILEPASRLRMKTRMPAFFFDCQHRLRLDNLYDALGQISKRKMTLLKMLSARIDARIQRDVSLVFYDVTTFYFESFEPDSLRARGMSKEHRTHERQVVLGLLIDNNGLALTYELFRGNTAEMHTLLQVVDQYRKLNPDGRVVVVADRSLNSRSNLSELRKRGCDYIVAYSLYRLNAEHRQQLFAPEEPAELRLTLRAVRFLKGSRACRCLAHKNSARRLKTAMRMKPTLRSVTRLTATTSDSSFHGRTGALTTISRNLKRGGIRPAGCSPAATEQSMLRLSGDAGSF